MPYDKEFYLNCMSATFGTTIPSFICNASAKLMHHNLTQKNNNGI